MTASKLIHVDLASGRRRLGGSALGQAYHQIGGSSPDVNAAALGGMWNTTQNLIASGKILSGNYISDGGAAVAILEMAFAGNHGLDVNLACLRSGAFASLYAVIIAR